ncbi:hypothetical protein AB4Z51_03345 [Bradyrhizobium sp. 2TAF36]|uniref:hypothetical protein n=1 Tax=Bradyrhizobium sp. 2TAF36 TaxID=3233016 RepID=UPI003F91E73D
MRKPKPARTRKKAARKKKRARPLKVAPLPQCAFSIPEFCKVHGGFSLAMYWKLKSQGLGPVEMRVGRRVLISAEAASAWRREREEVAA